MLSAVLPQPYEAADADQGGQGGGDQFFNVAFFMMISFSMNACRGGTVGLGLILANFF